MSIDLVIRNGTLVDPVDGVYNADIAVEAGKIAAILTPGSKLDGVRELNARGKHVMPGLIEPHTHIGFVNDFAADITTETATAAIGGITTVFSFHRHYKSAHPKPYDDFPEIVETVNRNAHVDFALHFGILAETQMQQLEKYIEWGVSSFKFYMAYRGADGKVVGMINEIDDGVMLDAFRVLGKYPHAVACVHCENTEIIGRRVRQTKQLGLDGLAAWNAARPSFAEAEHVRRAGYFAELARCNLYYVHIGAKPSLEEALKQKERYPNLTVETCPHYLTLTEDSDIGNLAKVNPPVRQQADLDRIWQGVLDGEIATIGTDHCAMPRARKAGDIWSAAAGFPGMATMLPVMLTEGYRKRGLSLQRIAQLLSHNAAKTFNLYPRKGALHVGCDADIVVVDLDLEKVVNPADLASSSDFSLYEGKMLKGWPVATLVRGTLVAEDGKITGRAGHGRFLKR
jgi:dihydropyrimidinase